MFQRSTQSLDIEVLIVPDATLILTAAVLEPLRAANRILGRQHYTWTISTPDGLPAMTTSGIPIPADRRFDPASSGAPLIVVASYRLETHMTRDLVRRLSGARRTRSAIGGVESGVFLLAEAGLLNTTRATTHWEDLEEFSSHYPDIDLRQERFVVDRNRFTAGGASPTLDLMLHLIRERQGAPLALDVSKLFIYAPDRTEQRRQTPSLGELIQSDARVAAAVRVMDGHIDQPLAIADIAGRIGLTARHLQTLFKRALGVAPADYYLGLRLTQARRQIIETRRPISEIASGAGFAHLAVFTRAYGRVYGEAPRKTRSTQANRLHPIS
jgi:transcriptional regulator GlxA family with amidase domain